MPFLHARPNIYLEIGFFRQNDAEKGLTNHDVSVTSVTNTFRSKRKNLC